MEESKLKNIANDYFKNTPVAKEIFLLKNGLIFIVESTAIKTAKRLNLGAPYKFVKPEEKAPVSKTKGPSKRKTTTKNEK